MNPCPVAGIWNLRFALLFLHFSVLDTFLIQPGSYFMTWLIKMFLRICTFSHLFDRSHHIAYTLLGATDAKMLEIHFLTLKVSLQLWGSQHQLTETSVWHPLLPVEEKEDGCTSCASSPRKPFCFQQGLADVTVVVLDSMSIQCHGHLILISWLLL